MKLPHDALQQCQAITTAISDLKELREACLKEIVDTYRQYAPGFVFTDAGKRYEVGEATLVAEEICYWCYCRSTEPAGADAPYLESTIDGLQQAPQAR